MVYLRDIAHLTSYHYNKANITMKGITLILFPRAQLCLNNTVVYKVCNSIRSKNVMYRP